MIDTGRSPASAVNLIREAALEGMGEALIGLCDGVEKYGLVDYQMGVWEEEILSGEVCPATLLELKLMDL